jgi:D-alanyl-D-alanine carboxypeptidase
VGVKTGSTGAAGGCFAFRAIRWIDGKRTTITGVVMGQPGDDLGEAGLAAAAAMVDGITGDRGTPDPGQPPLPPLTAPGVAAAHVVQRTVVNAISTREEKP